ncbi:divergent PAP2 family protein [Anaerospora hongkongensis]|uniref:divergent PAP2 family protein n=1 Tax=Anaerospora hongkongensis TaxID=244830 RepID=UPI00289D6F55|nr:divergent PAP2 family protein [Anaerospora hongkongensis]
MAEFWAAIGKNVILMTAFTAWAIAQILKTITAFWKHEKFKAERLVGAGGMPSSHTSLVVSLAAAIGFHDGVESSLFAVAVILASIVMYDAAGVRRAAGKQAKVLNKLMKELKTDHTVHDTRLKELLGHTPLEVLAGAVLGFFIAYLFSVYYK